MDLGKRSVDLEPKWALHLRPHLVCGLFFTLYYTLDLDTLEAISTRLIPKDKTSVNSIFCLKSIFVKGILVKQMLQVSRVGANFVFVRNLLQEWTKKYAFAESLAEFCF